MLKTKIENIPEKLKELNIWAVSKDGIPTNPFTNMGCKKGEQFSFDEVIKNIGDYEYLACHFDEEMGMAFIDIDGHNEEEEKLVNQFLNLFLLNFDSYMEVSKSGKGYHLIVDTEITKKYRVNANAINEKSRLPIEYYTSGKWCTITGELVHNRKEIRNNDGMLSRVLDKYFSERVETVSGGVEEGDEIRDDNYVINLINSDRFLSKLWNNNICNIKTRKGEVVTYNNHTADYILIRGIMYYCNANKKQAERIYKLSPKYAAYPFGYKREVDIKNALEDSLKTLNGVMKTKEERIAERLSMTDEEKQEELENILTNLSKEELDCMEQVDTLFDVTEEEKTNTSINMVDIKKIEPYVVKVRNLALKDAVNVYIKKRERDNDLIVTFNKDSELYTTSIQDLAEITKIVTGSEIFYSKSKESFVKYNGKNWEETDAEMLLSDVHKALKLLYDNAFKKFVELCDIYKELDAVIENYKKLDDDSKKERDISSIKKEYESRIKAEETFVLSKFTKVQKILDSNRTPEDVIEYIASEKAIDFCTYEKNDFINFQMVH